MKIERDKGNNEKIQRLKGKQKHEIMANLKESIYLKFSQVQLLFSIVTLICQHIEVKQS